MTVHHNFPSSNKRTQGATLIELIITIVIISISLTGILGVVNLTTSHSADPMMQHQAIAIAESYLEEILLLPLTDPNGSETGETRATFDDINDYDALADLGAKDQNGEALSGLENYTVNISVSPDTTPVSVSGIDMKEIIVTVSRPGTQEIKLTGYRADY